MWDFGRQSGTGTGFSLSPSVSPCQHHSPVTHHSLISSGGWTKGSIEAQFHTDIVSPHRNKNSCLRYPNVFLLTYQLINIFSARCLSTWKSSRLSCVSCLTLISLQWSKSRNQVFKGLAFAQLKFIRLVDDVERQNQTFIVYCFLLLLQIRPSGLLQFIIYFWNYESFCTYSFGGGSAYRTACTCTEHKKPLTNIHTSSGIRTHEPCGLVAITAHALDRVVMVIGHFTTFFSEIHPGSRRDARPYCFVLC
jgi:hypothetical protein